MGPCRAWRFLNRGWLLDFDFDMVIVYHLAYFSTVFGYIIIVCLFLTPKTKIRATKSKGATRPPILVYLMFSFYISLPRYLQPFTYIHVCCLNHEFIALLFLRCQAKIEQMKTVFAPTRSLFKATGPWPADQKKRISQR